jgi:hypothetical protein
MALAHVGGRPYWIAAETPERTVLVAADRPADGAFERFAAGEIEALGRAAAPSPTAEVGWLDADDGYYRSSDSPRPLPVLRVTSKDDGTWLYLDPRSGSIVQVLRRPDRVDRWLYHGLHSLDPIWLRTRRPLWDAVVIVLSVGGLALAATSAVPGWRRLRRAVRPRPGSPTARVLE